MKLKTHLAVACLVWLAASSVTYAQCWQAVGSGMDQSVDAFAIYNGELIAGGTFNSAGVQVASHIARWNGSVWENLGGGLDGGAESVDALTLYNNELIVGGYFDTAGGQSAKSIARWNGSNWLPLGNGITSTTGNVKALTVYNGKLIVGGQFSLVGSFVSANGIAQWTGSTWQQLNFEFSNVKL